MIAYVDEQIGRILEALEGRADAEDTLIIFTSDHGDFNGNHGMVKKDLVHIEDLLHVPFCVRLPGKRQAGRQVHALTEHVDLFPTLLDYAGVATNEPLHGTSLRPLLEGETETHKEAIFATVCPPGARNPYPDFRSFRAAWEAAQKDPAPHPLKYTRPYNVPGDHTRSIRTDRWRYVDYVDGFEELYDLAADPLETRNIASDPENSGVLDELRARLADHVEKHAVSTPAS
ncbi:MAG: DUF4976 domain-containing protein [Verrucomicrobia bacterium]|nr:MAG: DUF4976 domain-containing protein [Verrucomicrobiota bacterium]